jgi:hypothetical protein
MLRVFNGLNAAKQGGASEKEYMGTIGNSQHNHLYGATLCCVLLLMLKVLARRQYVGLPLGDHLRQSQFAFTLIRSGSLPQVL